MLQSIFVGNGLSYIEVGICSLISILIGFIIAFVYTKCSTRYTKDYVLTLVILPLIVQTVIMLVNGNLGVGVAVMGAFSLVRFRSIPGSAKEISVIFFSMAAGLATGMGYVTYALFITVIVVLVIVVVYATKFGTPTTRMKQLRVTIPEDLDYTDIFDDIFDKYTDSVHIENVKTTNLGSLFTVTYDVKLKKNVNEKEFIDDIRCRNGNLTVVLGRTTGNEAL